MPTITVWQPLPKAGDGVLVVPHELALSEAMYRMVQGIVEGSTDEVVSNVDIL
jgi:hypothetical protein